MNALFQSTDADAHKLFESLWELIKTSCGRIFTQVYMEQFKNEKLALEYMQTHMLENHLALLPVEHVDCGLEFERTCKSYNIY